MSADKGILLDTNVLIRMSQFTGDNYAESVVLKHPCYITFQNLAEYWAVASRPRTVNGLGLSTKEIVARIQNIRTAFPILNETPVAQDIWLTLCAKYQIKGRRTHDARIVSTALANGITVVATLDRTDYRSFDEISVLDMSGTPTDTINEPTASYAIGKMT